MYEFNAKQKKTLRDLGATHEGSNFIKVLTDMKSSITDISSIDSDVPVTDLGIHVEARKLVKQFITDLQSEISGKKKESNESEFDEYE